MPEKKGHWVTCPNCGTRVGIARLNKSGRKSLNIGVKNICDTLQACRDIALTAEKLGCSRAYIYRQLAKHGATPREVIEKK